MQKYESHTFTIKISMKIVFIGVYANNSSTVVYGGDILFSHFWSTMIKARYFHSLIFAPYQIFKYLEPCSSDQHNINQCL